MGTPRIGPALALAIALSLTTLTGCGAKGTEASPGASTSPATKAAAAQPESDCVGPIEYGGGAYHMVMGARIEAGAVGTVAGKGRFNGCDEGISAGASGGTRPVRKLDGVPTEQALAVTDSEGGSPTLYVNSAIDDGDRAAALTELLKGQHPDQ